MIRIGLTGGIGTGKTTVAQQWRERGAEVIDADLLAHRTLDPDSETWQAVIRAFGKGILNADRTVNRPKLGEIVFGDEQKRLMLNRIVHPAVHRMWTEELDRLGRDGRTEVTVAVIPLLYEVGAEKEFDCVVVTACSEQSQMARLTSKGLTETQARARIRAQWPLAVKIDKADYVIWNDGALQVLADQAAIIWNEIKERHHAPTKK